MSGDDELDRIACGGCDLGWDGYSVRVTGGDLAGAHLSVYACERCAPRKARVIRSEYPDSTTIVPLSGRVGGGS